MSAEFIDFKTIDEHGPQTYEATYDVAVSDLDRTELANAGTATIKAAAKPGDLDGEYIADGTVSFTADLTCSRCAEPYPIANTSTFHVRFRPRPEASEENEEVEFLGLINSGYANAGERTLPRPELAETFRRLCVREGKEGWSEATLRELVSRPELADLGALIRAGCEAGLFAERFPPERVSQLRQQMWFYPLAIREYTPPRLPVPVHYFEAMQGGSAAQGWRAFLTDAGIRVIPVPGAHMSMLGPENVPVLGQALSREIARAAEQRANR